MNESFTLLQIADATGLPLERLRYISDQKMLPGDRRAAELGHQSQGRGVARKFTPFTAFGIACAAQLTSVGLRRKMVINCLDLLCKPTRRSSRRIQDVPLYQAFVEREVAVIEVGDQMNLRMYGSEDFMSRLLDFGWRQIETGAELSNYEPVAFAGVNAAKIRKMLS